MSNRTVILAGATGLVGRQILDGLLADPEVAAVHALVRRTLTIQHPRLMTQVVDFTALPPMPEADEVYLALGTTIKSAGSEIAFRAVDFDANLAVAKAACAAGAHHAGVVSSMGADPSSSVFYTRVKGELERALRTLPFKGLVIARPSLLVGNREALGQKTRLGEEISFAIGRAFGFMIPANYKPIDAAAVARALRTTVPITTGTKVVLSGEMQRG